MPLKQTTGSRAQVMHGTAKKTSGGLTKSQLKYNKQGKIVSKKASALAKKNNRLVKAGYVTRKGEFGVSMRGGELSNTVKFAAIKSEISRMEIEHTRIRAIYDSKNSNKIKSSLPKIKLLKDQIDELSKVDKLVNLQLNNWFVKTSPITDKLTELNIKISVLYDLMTNYN